MKKKSRKVAVTAASLVMLSSASTLLAACGEPSAVPMNDEFAGNSGQDEHDTGEESKKYTKKDSASSSNAPDASDGVHSGSYRDGKYAIKGQYGPVGEDSIDVYVTLAHNKISDLKVVGHPFTSISRKHQDAFIKAINGVVVGKDLKDLKVDVVAGASWTSGAFNKALEVARKQASAE